MAQLQSPLNVQSNTVIPLHHAPSKAHHSSIQTVASLRQLYPPKEAAQPEPQAKRRRGMILSPPGWDKLSFAKTQAEFNENAGDRFTLEELSERMGLSLNTIAKVLGRSEAVDKQSLQCAFRAFGLELSKNDYTRMALK
jgi:hypothetical protein